MERAIEEGLPILDAKYLLTISIDDCRKIFRAVEGAIPLLAERAASLQEAGGFLLARCNGQFINLIEDCEFDALKIVGELALLPFWRDISKMEGRDVVLLKRAQICAHDAGLVLRKHGKKIENTDMLTAFADYKLPQIMRMFGVMQYAPGLAKKIDAYIELLHDSREEIEIRASTIIAVERLKRLCDNMTAPEIDNVLWFLSQDIQEQSKPYHRTRTIFY